jgi:hypothetical protein
LCVTPYSLVDRHQHFRRICCLHRNGKRYILNHSVWIRSPTPENSNKPESCFTSRLNFFWVILPFCTFKWVSRALQYVT